MHITRNTGVSTGVLEGVAERVEHFTAIVDPTGFAEITVNPFRERDRPFVSISGQVREQPGAFALRFLSVFENAQAQEVGVDRYPPRTLDRLQRLAVAFGDDVEEDDPVFSPDIIALELTQLFEPCSSVEPEEWQPIRRVPRPTYGPSALGVDGRTFKNLPQVIT